MSRVCILKRLVVGVYKCLSLIAGVAAIWRREVVSYRDFILRAVATFWAMSLVGIYPGRVSYPREDKGDREGILHTNLFLRASIKPGT